MQGRRYDDPQRCAINAVIATYRREARLRNLAWRLSLETCITLFKAPCNYCGTSFSNSLNLRFKHAIPFKYNGIDRVDNNRGYTAVNVVACCRTCNCAKRDMTIDVFIEWVRRVYNHTQEH
jgi:5-methylcytosine-specific restriction endonuclease McrA